MVWDYGVGYLDDNDYIWVFCLGYQFGLYLLNAFVLLSIIFGRIA